jgi:hypothetical protein
MEFVADKSAKKDLSRAYAVSRDDAVR